MSRTPIRILSLGAGVQSSTVLLMSCLGVLPKLDAAIFADTQWEPAAVYDWMQQVLGPAAETAGIPLYMVTKGSIRAHAIKSCARMEDGKRWASIPFYTIKRNGQTEKVGQIKRQCTKEYKIEPIRAQTGKLARAALRVSRLPLASVQLWYGISGDEMRRMRMSKVGYIENYYPLIFGLERPYHRHDCMRWLKEHGFPPAPRSACLGCPYHSDEEWRAIKADPVQWQDVVEFDAATRKVGGMYGETFLHRTCRPLPMVDLESMEDKGQENWLNECEGMCGV